MIMSVLMVMDVLLCVLTPYMLVAGVLAWVIKEAKPGAKIVQLCTEADKQILE